MDSYSVFFCLSHSPFDFFLAKEGSRRSSKTTMSSNTVVEGVKVRVTRLAHSLVVNEEEEEGCEESPVRMWVSDIDRS